MKYEKIRGSDGYDYYFVHGFTNEIEGLSTENQIFLAELTQKCYPITYPREKIHHPNSIGIIQDICQVLPEQAMIILDFLRKAYPENNQPKFDFGEEN